METETLETSNKNKNLIILLALLLLISFIGNFVFLQQKTTLKSESKVITTELDSVINVKTELSVALQNATNELQKYIGISVNLDSIIVEANDKIKAQENKIANLAKNAKNSKELTAQLQEEIAILKKLKDEYLDKIDELLISNTQLKREKLDLIKTNTKLNAKVALGEQLIADNITVKPIKKNLFGKYTQTAMANKTVRLEICYAILANKLIKAGEQKIFIRIMNPEGVTIFDKAAGSGQTNNPEFNVIMDYTMLDYADYKNEQFNNCLEWDATDKYIGGTYIVNIYSEDNLMGSSTFSLK